MKLTYLLALIFFFSCNNKQNADNYFNSSDTTTIGNQVSLKHFHDYETYNYWVKTDSLVLQCVNGEKISTLSDYSPANIERKAYMTKAFARAIAKLNQDHVDASAKKAIEKFTGTIDTLSDVYKWYFLHLHSTVMALAFPGVPAGVFRAGDKLTSTNFDDLKVDEQFIKSRYGSTSVMGYWKFAKSLKNIAPIEDSVLTSAAATLSKKYKVSFPNINVTPCAMYVYDNVGAKLTSCSNVHTTMVAKGGRKKWQ